MPRPARSDHKPTRRAVTIPTNTRTRKSSSNSNGNGRKRETAKRETKREQPAASTYEETPGWGSAFHRPDNEAPQPTYTGEGVMDAELLKAIHQAGGEFQIAVWPRRTRNGAKILRFHIEPPYQAGENSDLDEDEFAEFDGVPKTEADEDADDDGEDMPF